MSEVLLNPVTNLRVDKNFAYNISVFRKYDAEDRSLLKDIILYVTLYFQQENLFGYYNLDPDHFCKIMGRKKNKIFAKHENPIFYKISDKSKEELIELEQQHGRLSKHRIWDTKFENALLILKYETLISSYAHSGPNTDRVTIEDFQYFKKIHIVVEKRGKARKIIYQYQPTEEFKASLIRFFCNVNLKTYLNTKQKHLDECYFELINRVNGQELKQKTETFYNIIEFAKLLNISAQALLNEAAHNKTLSNGQKPKKGAFTDLKRKINRKFNTFQDLTDTDFNNLELTWTKAPGARSTNYDNVVKISWTGKSEAVRKEEVKKIFDDLFFTELIKDLSFFFNNNHTLFEVDNEIVINKFLNWLFSDKDFEIKKSKYVSVFVDTKGGGYTKIEDKAIQFFSNLINVGKANDKEQLFYYQDKKFIVVDPKQAKKHEYGHIKEMIYLLDKHHEYFRS